MCSCVCVSYPAAMQGEKASLKERLNDAIQERWATEEELRKAIAGGGAGGGEGGAGAGGAGGGAAGGIKVECLLVSVCSRSALRFFVQGALQAAEEKAVELEMKIRDLSRKLQDAEGEAKRARMELQEAKAKHGDAILKLKEQQAENDKLVTGLKLLSQQVIELEENGGADEEMEADLAAAEELAEQLEEQVRTLKEQLAAAGGPPDTSERDALREQLAAAQKELADRLMAFSAVEEEAASREEQARELQQQLEVLAVASATQLAAERARGEALQREAAGGGQLAQELAAAAQRESEARAALAAATEDSERLRRELQSAQAAVAAAAATAAAAAANAGGSVAESGEAERLREEVEAGRRRQAELEAELAALRASHDTHSVSRAQLEEELRQATAQTDQRIADLEMQLKQQQEQQQQPPPSAQHPDTTAVPGGGERVAELEGRLAELEQRTAYLEQVEQVSLHLLLLVLISPFSLSRSCSKRSCR